MLQLYFFKESIKELGFDNKNISIDHKQGYNYYNSKQYDIKYPKNYIDRINSLSKDKKFDYCFIGSIGKLGRKELLKQFETNKSIIKDSHKGRDTDTKYIFDTDYYQTICKSKFSLCPNHIGAWYVHDRAWTYRYIESLFCKSIPIVFRETPLGYKFLKDTFFLWNNQSHDLLDDEYLKIVEDNYQKSIKYWTFILNGNIEI